MVGQLIDLKQIKKFLRERHFMATVTVSRPVCDV